jgi:magnesium transporter
MLETLPSVNKAVCYDVLGRAFHPLTHVAELDDLAVGPEQLLWLDLELPGPDEMAQLAERFHLHPLAVEDAERGHQRPKIEEYEGFVFLVFYAVAPGAGGRDVQTTELRMFASAAYLITIHDAPLTALDEVERRWTRNAQQVEWGIGVLLYSLLDTLVDGYFPVADGLVERAEDLDARIFAEREGGRARDTRFTYDLLELKRVLLAFRRLVAPERDVLNVLTNRDSPVFNERTLVYFRDVYDHLARLTDTLDLYRDQLAGTMDANLSLASNDLNRVMRTLTACSIILMSGALIAGIYGMNFDFIPELHWRFGYLWALGLIALVSLGLWRYFKHLKWF